MHASVVIIGFCCYIWKGQIRPVIMRSVLCYMLCSAAVARNKHTCMSRNAVAV